MIYLLLWVNFYCPTFKCSCRLNEIKEITTWEVIYHFSIILEMTPAIEYCWFQCSTSLFYTAPLPSPEARVQLART